MGEQIAETILSVLRGSEDGRTMKVRSRAIDHFLKSATSSTHTMV